MKILLKGISGFWIAMLCMGAPATEFRAFWAGTFSPYDSNRVAALIADARAGHFNAIVPELRNMSGYCYFDSHVEPKSPAVPSGYDPLAGMIAQAHNTNAGPRIQVHPWIIIYPIWLNTAPPTSPTHTYNLHPDWLMKESDGGILPGGYHRLDPGHPEVQRYLFSVCMDLITNYDIDGFNFDNIRYTGQTAGYNEVAVARFNSLYSRTGQPATADPVWMQFRRDQVSALVRKVYLSAIAIKPWLTVSADTITGSPGATNDLTWLSSSAYSSLLQDWRGWMEEGILDLNIPMAYFDQATAGQAYANWNYFTKNHQYNRQAVVGPGVYLNTISNSIRQIRLTREATSEGNRGVGLCCFSYQSSNNEGKTLATLLNALTQPSAYDPVQPPVFASEDVPAEMPWKAAPSKGHLKGYVYDETTNSLDGAQVVLSGPVTRTLTSDATGFFGAVDLPPGSYTVAASFPAYAWATGVVSVVPGAVSHKDISLQASGITMILQPQDRVGVAGSNVALNARAGGLKPLSYQWLFNGAPIPGATNDSLSFDTVQATNSGAYRIAASNSSGSVTSLVASLTIQFRIQAAVVGNGTVSLSPQQSSYASGSSVTLSANPLAGFAFSNWSGDITSQLNPLTVLVTSNVSLVASFASSPYDLILDNGEATLTGTWTLSSMSTDRYGADYRWASTISGTSSATATYRPRIPLAGNYDVLLWYPPGSNRSTNAPWQVSCAGGTVTSPVDQTTRGSNWVQIAAAKYFEAGTNGFVRLSNGTGAGGSVVIADAVRFLRSKTQRWTPARLISGGAGTSGSFGLSVFANPGQSWLIEYTTNWERWLPLETVWLRDPLQPWLDEGATDPQRFYRARLTNVLSLADFETNALGRGALFQPPAFSGTTIEFVDTNRPNYIMVTNVFPSGNSSARVLQASWTFVGGASGGNPWLRLTTHNAVSIPNPVVSFHQGIGFAAYASRDIYLAAGLRETSPTASIGADGGVSGPIEWVGGITDNTTSPPRGRFIPAGQWVWVAFTMPAEPVRGFTGNGLLESTTGKGVFEELTVIPADGLGAYTLYLDEFQLFDLAR